MTTHCVKSDQKPSSNRRHNEHTFSTRLYASLRHQSSNFIDRETSPVTPVNDVMHPSPSFGTFCWHARHYGVYIIMKYNRLVINYFVQSNTHTVALWQGGEQLPNKFWAFDNKNFHSKMPKFGLKTPTLGKCRHKIEILSTDNLLCRKKLSIRKLQLPVMPTFFWSTMLLHAHTHPFINFYKLLHHTSPVTGTFVPRNFRSQERKFHGWNFRYLELSFPGTFVPRNLRSLELSFPGTFVPWNFRSHDWY